MARVFQKEGIKPGLSINPLGQKHGSAVPLLVNCLRLQAVSLAASIPGNFVVLMYFPAQKSWQL